jgi:hypothetical protein
MPTVWVRQDPKHRTRFHRGPDCRQLTKRPSRGAHHDLVAADLSVVHVRPCRTCYPDAPHLELRKRYCPICDSRHACSHNGGIAVTDRRGRTFWVWPDTNQMPYYRRQSMQAS